MSKPSEFVEIEKSYIEKVTECITESEDFGIHMSIELDENDGIKNIGMHTNVPDKSAVMQILKIIMETEGYTVTLGE